MSNLCYEICFVDEILAGTFPSNDLKLVRVLGKLKCYNPTTCVGRFVDPECKTPQTLLVNLQHIDEVSFIKDSLYHIIGELKDVGSGEKLIEASIAKNMDGIDVQLFKEAVSLRRKFLSEQ